MTWEIVVGIITLIGVFATIAKGAASLSRSLASLEVVTDNLKQAVIELKGDNEKNKDDNERSHSEFRITLNDHEKRIAVLEHKN